MKLSGANQKAIEDAGLSFILGTKIPGEPYVDARDGRAAAAARPMSRAAP